MVSPELLRRYPFFAGLKMEQIALLAQAADEQIVEAGNYLFHEGVEIQHMYLTMEGAVGIVMELPAQDTKHTIADQLVGSMQTEDVVVTSVGPGDVFGWSAMLPPHQATAGAKALTRCHVISFPGVQLLEHFVEDCELGYIMAMKAASVIRERLHDMRIESLAHMAT